MMKRGARAITFRASSRFRIIAPNREVAGMLSKIARYHCSLKNMVKPLNRFPTEELEQEIVPLGGLLQQREPS
jgi:hypothetical protein